MTTLLQRVVDQPHAAGGVGHLVALLQTASGGSIVHRTQVDLISRALASFEEGLVSNPGYALNLGRLVDVGTNLRSFGVSGLKGGLFDYLPSARLSKACVAARTGSLDRHGSRSAFEVLKFLQKRVQVPYCKIVFEYADPSHMVDIALFGQHLGQDVASDLPQTHGLVGGHVGGDLQVEQFVAKAGIRVFKLPRASR